MSAPAEPLNVCVQVSVGTSRTRRPLKNLTCQGYKTVELSSVIQMLPPGEAG